MKGETAEGLVDLSAALLLFKIKCLFVLMAY